MFSKLKEKARDLKQEVVPIYYALFDKRTPLLTKILAGLTVAYLLSPIDLIPGFIPVIGLLDDLIIVSLMIRASIKLILTGAGFPPCVCPVPLCRFRSMLTHQKKYYRNIPATHRKMV
ncbi:MAG: YkvA family protein [Ferruginibacter sp.]